MIRPRGLPEDSVVIGLCWAWMLGMVLVSSGCPGDGGSPPGAGSPNPAEADGGGSPLGRDAGSATGAGLLDDSFGDHGTVLSSVVGPPTSLVVASDDRLLVGLGDGRVARFSANGALDPTFGVAGVTAPPDPSPYTLRQATNIVVLPDGRIIVAICASPRTGASVVALVRYLSDGTPDLSLGNRGILFLTLDPTTSHRPVALATWPGPKGLNLVIGGMPGEAVGGPGPLVIRTDLDGVPDTSFADDKTKGWVAPEVGTTGWATLTMAVQPEGKIVLAGIAWQNRLNMFGIVRINENGSWDKQFGQTGLVTLAFADNSEDHANAIMLLPDTRFLVAGFTTCVGLCPSRFAVARFYGDGSLDTSFGQQGKLILVYGGVQALALVQGGQIVMAGFGLENKIVELGGGWGSGSPQIFSLARANSAGVLDQSFGLPSTPDPPGVVQTSFGEAYTRSSVVAVSMQSTGKLVAAGSVGSFAGSGSLVGLARYLP